MKTIALYLPQFHRIPENDEWWGEGFTEWTNVRQAKPMYEGHYQPRIPYNHNYYNLLDVDTIRWQAKIAKEYGVYGFCIYHYWFDGHLLLEKPLELLRDNEDIDINYCICWANEDWTNSWVSESNRTLIAQRYGDKEQWQEHFEYLQSFFDDRRYIQEDGKPLVIIYRPELIGKLNQMLDYWDDLARQHGYNGLTYAYQHVYFALQADKDDSRFKYAIDSQPAYTMLKMNSTGILSHLKRGVKSQLEKRLHWKPVLHSRAHEAGPKVYSYDEIWEEALQKPPASEKSLPCGFTGWDNTPRKRKLGYVFDGGTPEKFKIYIKRLIERAVDVYKADYLFLFAWNEWAEGGYLEPDERFKFGYLEALKEALLETGEFPS